MPAANPKLQALVADLASLGISQDAIEYLTDEFTEHSLDDLQTVYDNNLGTPGGGGGGPTFEYAEGGLGGQNVNVNAQLNITSTSVEGGWSITGNAATYTGTPDKVKIYVNLQQTGAVARGNPQVDVQKNGATVVSASSSYIRNSGGHNTASNNLAWVDLNPGTNPSYTLVGIQEAVAGVTTSEPESSILLEAVL